MREMWDAELPVLDLVREVSLEPMFSRKKRIRGPMTREERGKGC